MYVVVLICVQKNDLEEWWPTATPEGVHEIYNFKFRENIILFNCFIDYFCYNYFYSCYTVWLYVGQMCIFLLLVYKNNSNNS